MGVDVNTPEKPPRKTDTALHRAVTAIKGTREIVQLLLDNGANIEALGNCAKTPLHLAASWGFTERVELLLQRGACTDAVDHVGYSPLMCAARFGRADVVRIFLERGARFDCDCVFVAVRWGRLSVLEVLLEYGADVSAQQDEVTLLEAAHSAPWTNMDGVKIIMLLEKWEARQNLVRKWNAVLRFFWLRRMGRR